MKINIQVPTRLSNCQQICLIDFSNTKDGHNVQGDEVVAIMWAQNLAKDPRVTDVFLNAPEYYECDISISFNPFIAGVGKRKILYMQNVYTDSGDFSGTVNEFHKAKDNFDGYIFPSKGLRDKCEVEGLVLQFATDLNYFSPKPHSTDFAHNLCFVGNSIRTPEIRDKYLLCTVEKGLVVYGNMHSWNHPLGKEGYYYDPMTCRGIISIEDEATLYSSSKICLNAHISDHLDYGSFNFRIFNILACGGFIISDWSEHLEKEFNDCMVFTTGYDDLINKVDYYLKHTEETKPYRQAGIKLVKEKHTFKHRMEALLNWL